MANRQGLLMIVLVVASSFSFIGVESQKSETSTPRTITLDFSTIIKFLSALSQSPLMSLASSFTQTTATPITGNALTSGQLDAMLERVATLDAKQCIPRLLCEIHATIDKRPLTELESLVVSVFNDFKSSSSIKSAASIYEMAVTMGKRIKSPSVCLEVFPTCAHSSQQLFRALNE